MGFLDFVVLLIVAAVAGGIGQAIAGYSRAGCLGSIDTEADGSSAIGAAGCCWR